MFNQGLLVELQSYVDTHLQPIFHELKLYSAEERIISEEIQNVDLEEFIKIKRQPTFNQTLFRYIDKKGASDADIYKRAGMDRRHFSKIRSNPEYKPGKNTVIALALALELTKKETDKLLSSAGYSLSDSDTFDLVIQFCLEKKIYNFYDINQALDYFSLNPLL
ncbi:hypothetical protein F4694_005189 [Bacillus niacini]|uniref:XRE family transcriptional regulator n=1 Tax=Neobacillus niacini TaxID=86668 RepID=A0A852TJI9_9BACI|nr:hypothetical protein [Neobacillus niacini]NYE08345.1 hypothetical protein [Neobacillus niacini]